MYRGTTTSGCHLSLIEAREVAHPQLGSLGRTHRFETIT